MSTSDHQQLINRNEPGQHMAKAVIYGGVPLNQQLDAMKADIAARPDSHQVAADYYDKVEVDARLLEKAGTDHGAFEHRDDPGQHPAAAISYAGSDVEEALGLINVDLADRPTTADIDASLYPKSAIDTRMAGKAGLAVVSATENGLATPELRAFSAFSDIGMTEVAAMVPPPTTVSMHSDKVVPGRHYFIGFVAPKGFEVGDTFLFNGKETVTRMADGEAPPHGLFAAGVQKIATLDTTDTNRYVLTFAADRRGDTGSGNDTLDAECFTVGTSHELRIAGIPRPLPDLFTVRTTMDADYLAGNDFLIDGVTYEARTPMNEPAQSRIANAGATIELVVDSNRKLVFFTFCSPEEVEAGEVQWNISVYGETPVREGIHVLDGVRPSRVYVDVTFDDFAISAKQVACGDYHTLILLKSGRVLSCGANYAGQLGRTTDTGTMWTENISSIPGLTDVIAVAAGGGHSLFLRRDGTVLSCGSNDNGELGREVNKGSATISNLGVVTGVSNVVSIACGTRSSFFLLANGTVYACGANGYCQLGHTSMGMARFSNLRLVPDLANVMKVAAGYSHTLFLRKDGTVYSCGFNDSGQLGRIVANGGGTVSGVVVGNLGRIAELSSVKDIAAGHGHSVFVLGTGAVWSCGTNNSGQLGRVVKNGKPSVSNLGQIPNLFGIRDVMAGGNCTTFIKSDGTVWNCGSNSYGMLGREGNGGSDRLSNLEQVPGLHNIMSVGVGSGNSAFLTGAGSLAVCGDNRHGQVGCWGSNTINGGAAVWDITHFHPNAHEPLTQSYEEDSLLIIMDSLDQFSRVRLSRFDQSHLRMTPKRVFQVKNGMAVEKAFEIRGGL